MQTDIQLHQGDCLEVLKTLNDNSIDSVVTDPPYGINFMGKKWDYNVPNVEVWQQVLRVLKPGGHALVACGTRTQHRMAVNLEDAGFEIRDIVAWVYGSGFPKSQNIGKAVDKLQGNEREVVGEKILGGIKRARPDNAEGYSNPYTSGQTKGIETKGNSKHEGWGTALKPAMELFTLCRKPLAEKTIAKNVLKYNTGGINIDDCRVETEDNLNGGTYSGHKREHKGGAWQNSDRKDGKGSGLRRGVGEFKQPTGRFPANFIHDGSDEIVSNFPDTKGDKRQNKLQRKTFAFGNKSKDGLNTPNYNDSGSASRYFYVAKFRPEDNIEPKQGRFPANFIHDGSDEVVNKFPLTKSSKKAKRGLQQRHDASSPETANQKEGTNSIRGHNDNGGPASRFFYCAKTSKSERNKGLEGFTEKANMRVNAPRQNEEAKHANKMQNNHPTVKPIKLMKYLCRLITPVDGIVLDPYMGSGSTGIAAKQEGFNFTGIELDKDYFKIAKARINAKEAQEKLF